MKRALAVVAVLSPFTLGGTCGGGSGSPPPRPLFEAVAQYPAGAWPECIVAADLDGDGHVDLAVGSVDGRSVSILHANGGGRFTPGRTYVLPSLVEKLVAADLDGNGYRDLLAGTYSGTQVLKSIDGLSYTVGTAFGGMILGEPADVDGDGRPDVVTTDAGSTVRLWLGRGDGTFAQGPQLDAGADPDSAAFADVDGDGRLDLVVANIDTAGTVTVLRQLAGGAWASPVAYPAGQYPRSVIARDLDGDGHVDLALASYFRVAVLLGNGDGTFAPKVEYGGSIPGIFALAAGDLDGDGRIDLAAAVYESSGVRVFRNLGSGTFGASPSVAMVGTRPRAIAIADLNGDGDLDLATADMVTGTASVLLGRGDGTFEEATRHYPGYSASEVALGDLDGDGLLDAVVTHYFSDAISVSRRRADGTFQYGPSYAVGTNPQEIRLADLDHDGHLDAVVLDHGSADVAVLRGRADGTFEAAGLFPTTATPLALALGDLDEDGNLDGVVVDLDDVLVVHLGGGNGTFGPPTAFAVTRSPRAVALADLDRDGHLDAVVTSANGTAGGIFVLRGNGDGTFRSPVAYGCPQSLGLALGDLNGDGWPDAVAAEFLGSAWVLLGDGAGGFRAASALPVGASPDEVALGDLDGDGKVDLVVSLTIPNPTAHPDFPWAYRLSVLRGKGDGTFAEPEAYAAGRLPTTPALGDVDGDGDLDVAVVALEDNALWVYRNTTIVPDTTPPVVTPPPDVAVEATGPLTPVDLGTATAVDAVSGTLVPTPSPAGPFPLGTTVVTWSATDAAGNTGSATQLVTVRDTTPPALSPPPDLVVEATGPLTPVDLGTAMAVDLVSGAVTAVPSPTGPFPLGTTLVTWVAVDGAGNSVSAHQRVTVRDTTPPAIQPPPDVVAVATGALTPVALGTATAVDLVDGPVPVTPSTTGPFPPGTTVVTWTATDGHGNSGSALQRVTVSLQFQGFLPPVRNPPAVNRREAGCAVPMKWTIGDGSGGHMGDVALVTRLEYAEVPCDWSTPGGLPVPAEDAGKSGLRYDPSCGQFTFAWKTPRHTATGCVLFILTLSDGSQHLARFELQELARVAKAAGTR